MCILKYLDVDDCRLPSFMCDLLKDPVISTLVSKSHVCTMWLQFFNTLYSICWEFRNPITNTFDIFVLSGDKLLRESSKSTLCNVAMKGSPWSSHIFIHDWSFCFTVTWCTFATSMCLSVSSNESGIKSVTSGVMWHVAQESKIQLVNCELSPEFPLVHLSLLYMGVIDAYIFWSLLFSLLSRAWLPFLY